MCIRDRDPALKNTLELLDATGQALRNLVKNSANLKGYLKYNNFADDEELKKKVKEFQEAYMDASNEGGLGGLDNTCLLYTSLLLLRLPYLPVGRTPYTARCVFSCLASPDPS